MKKLSYTYFAIWVSFTLSACQSTPVVNRVPATITNAESEEAERLTQANVLEAIGFLAEGAVLEKEAKRLNLRMQLKNYTLFKPEMTSAFATFLMAPLLSIGGIGTSVTGSYNREERQGFARLIMDKMFFGNQRVFDMSFTGTFFSSLGSIAVTMDPATNQADAEGPIATPARILHYLFRLKAIAEFGREEARKTNQEVKAKFMKELKMTASQLADRATLLLRLRVTDRSLLAVQFQDQLAKAYGRDDDWTKNTPVKIDVSAILAKVDIDLNERLAAIDSVVKSIDPGQVRPSETLSAKDSNEFIAEMKRLSATAADIYADNSESKDRKVKIWAQKNLMFSDAVEHFRDRLLTQRQLQK